MFKLHRHRSDKSGERIEFKFSNFRATEVPKGWDKIYVSIVSVETGKAIAKTSKTHVRNGISQWTESISEQIWFYQDSASKEFEECQYKIVILMGSTRTASLGEISFNLSDYLSANEPSLISSPLKKCNCNTTLQFNIQCLSTKQHKMRDAKSAKEGSSHHEELTANNDSKSDDEPETRETSFSASHSHSSSNSGDIALSPRNPNPNGCNTTAINRQDSNNSFTSTTSSSFRGGTTPQPLTSSLTSSLVGADSASTKELLEAAEETIEELRDEAKMWERHSRKVKIEMENLKKENVEKSKIIEEVNLEKDLLRDEVEKLKNELELSVNNNNTGGDMKDEMIDFGTPKYDDEVANMHKEMEDEMVFLKESNLNLNLQIKKTKEANVELLDIVKEMEEAIEAQKDEFVGLENEWKRKFDLKEEEIGTLKELISQKKVSNNNNKNDDDKDVNGDNGNFVLEREIEELKAKIQELEKDCAELTEENLDLLYKMKNNEKGGKISSRDVKLPGEINEFEVKCAELEIKLQGFEEENDNLLYKLENSEKELKEKTLELEGFNEKLEESKIKIDSLIREIDSHVSVNKGLERKSKDLELKNSDFELEITEIEQENVHLSERISGLEAQLRYLTNDQEANRIELEDSRSLIQELKQKVVKQQVEVEKAKMDYKEKLQEAQEKLLIAQEDAEVLRRSNSKIQSTVEGLIEECSSLQNLNSNLRRQKVELHENVTRLEMQLEESSKKCEDFSKRVENLEVKLNSLQNDALNKEQTMVFELEKLTEENKEQEERLNKMHLMLKKLENEKSVEIENLKREIETLSDENNHEDLQLDNVREMNNMRSEKAKLESSLNDANSQIRVYELEIETLKKDSKNNVQGLIDLLNASKRSEEMLVADVEHMRGLMETKKLNEEKINKKSNELEVKLKSAEYEKQQIMEEISDLKNQVQKISQLQEEILGLKGSLDETKFEKSKLDEKLKVILEEREELDREKKGLEEKVSNMEKRLNNGEDERRNKVVLEAKLVRLQSDLSLKEASGAIETELKNEINRIRRANSEYQRRIQSLEEEKTELLKKQQEGNNKVPQESGDTQLEKSATEENKMSVLEAELKDMKERYLNMSLQYAEVEAQREELVMKLKSTKTTKGWFS